jgi:transglutaminase-like putative cysteine protease
LGIDVRENMPSSMVYRNRFGSLIRAYQMIGYSPARDYRYIEINRALRDMHPAVVANAIAEIRSAGGDGDLTLWGDATIEDSGAPEAADPGAREIAVADLPDECLVYLMGSRYCETDKLSQAAWDLFGALAPGWGRVQAVCDFVHNRIRFDYQQARSTRTAFEAFNERIGVCRDYAHLALTLCRCLNIPARYINGHMGDIGVPVVDPMDFSAWIEVYLDGGWRTFDPRNNIPRIGRIVVARGRDAADIPLIMSFGPHLLKSFRVWTYEVVDLPAAENANPEN